MKTTGCDGCGEQLDTIDELFHQCNEEIKQDFRLRRWKWIKENIEHGLENSEIGITINSRSYFSQNDFETVLERCEKYGAGIWGIETWPNNEFFGCRVREEVEYATDPLWYWKAYRYFVDLGVHRNFTCSFHITEEILKK